MRMINGKALSVFTALGTSLAFVVPALAQDGQPQASPSAGGQTSASSPAEASVSGEIIVTARRREERLLDVPVSVAVQTGETLAAKGISRVDDLQFATPSLKLTPSAGRRSNSQYQLRGISAQESLITQDPTVGIYVNEVYRARATGTNQSFFDIANVQTLYGPQGTLFGRNSTGGAVLINTNVPTDNLEGSLEAGYGRFNRFESTAVLNLPLADGLMVRFAGQRLRSDGYARNVSTGAGLGGTDSWSGRVSILFEPSTSVSNLLVVSGYRANDQGSATTLYGYRASATPDQFGEVPLLASIPALNALGQAAFAYQKVLGPYRVAQDALGATLPLPGGGVIPLTGLTAPLQRRSALANRNPYERPRNYSISNTTTVQLSDSLIFKNILGYNYTALNTSTDLDGTAIKLIDTYYETKNNQFSDEVQLQGESSRFNWVVGGLYFREVGLDYQPATNLINFYATSRLRGVNTSAGVFAQGTYKLTDHLNLTAGGRYTWDKRQILYYDLLGGSGNITTPGVDLDATAQCFLTPQLNSDGTCSLGKKTTFKQPSWTASIDYKPSNDILFYLAHRHGYRSGGFNARILNGTAAEQLEGARPFAPEKVNDVEVGFKGQFRSGDITIRPSIAIYKAWYTDIQKQIAVKTATASNTLIRNAGKANAQGLEGNLGVSFGRMIDVEGFIGIVDGKYKDFPAPNGTVAAPVFTDVDYGASKYTGGATLTVTPIDDDQVGRVSAVGSWSYRSSFYPENALPTLNREARVGALSLFNAALNWENVAGSNFEFSGWIKNITNTVNYLGVLDLIPVYGIAISNVGEPRTYGATVKYTFGR